MRKSIAIVGAGAKAAAIVARAAVLRQALDPADVPDITVFERSGVGAAWTGENGFSSGFQTLCTPGEKDVGFPYDDRTAWFEQRTAIAPLLFERFSWSAFLIATGGYREWVDRGRDHPRHSHWADYLQWVFDQAGQSWIETDLGPGCITRAREKWEIRYRVSGTEHVQRFDGVVLTGSGTPRDDVTRGRDIPDEFVLDAHTFWESRFDFKLEPGQGIAVAGSGGAAATIIGWLLQRYGETNTPIYAISPQGTMFPRGDGHSERRWFSDPEHWNKLTEAHRDEVIRRTEAGVVSLRIKEAIDRDGRNLVPVLGKAKALKWTARQPGSSSAPGGLGIRIDYDGKTEWLTDSSYFIDAIGYDGWALLRLIDHRAAASLLTGPNLAARRLKVERQICDDLSLPRINRMPKGLHMPVLAALKQGPGMPNLGSLGLVAREILRPYLR
jgi:mycobactin lysine-N-oxygenase